MPIAALAVLAFLQGRIGLCGPEIYKADKGSSGLVVEDCDGDGLDDVAFADNSEAVIVFLLQKTAAELALDQARPPEVDPARPNDPPSDRRFRRETYLTEKKVFSWTLADVTADGRPDLVFYGDPRELVVVPRGADGTWSAKPARWKVAEGSAAPRGLAAADFDGDGRVDVALACQTGTMFWRGGAHGLDAPVEVPSPDRAAVEVLAGDFDGDGRADLLYVAPASREPFKLRLQEPGGLGPTLAFELPTPRRWTAGDLDRDGRTDLLLVDEVTGHLRGYRLARAERSAPGLGGARIYPLAPDDEAKRRRLAVADVTGDGRADVVVTRPAAARLDVHVQTAGGTLAPARGFPVLAKVADLAVADVDADGANEILVLSPDEQSIGVARWTADGIDFPAAVGVAHKPLALGVGDLDLDGTADWVLVTKDGKEQRLLVHTGGLAAALERGIDPAGADVLAVALEDARDPPETVALFDADRDGRTDVLLFFAYEPLRLYLNRPGAGDAPLALEEIAARASFGRGLVEKAVPESFFATDYDRDGKAEFLLAKENFARALFVGQGGRIEVAEQFPAGPKAQVDAAAAIDADRDGVPEVVLHDKAQDELLVLARRDGAFAERERIALPKLALRGMAVADLDGDGAEDLLIAAEDQFLVLPAGGAAWALEAALSYASDVEDGRLACIALGDLDGGRPEVFAVETREQQLEVLRAGEAGVARVLGFKVFEAKAFQRQQSLDEPREIALGDVTGDGLADVVALVHDRVLVYPQEGAGR